MVQWPEIPDGVIAGIQLRWPERAAAWTANVQTELRELCEKYDATPRTALHARYGFVVAADTPHGGIVLRSSPDPDGPAQAQVAAALANLGVSPAIHETRTSDVNTWTVMDEVRPGTPLAYTDPDTVSIDALAVPLAAMRDQPVPVPGMPSVFDWLRNRLEDDNLTEIPPWMEPAPASQRRAALKVLDELAQDAEPAICHGDVSKPNVLANGTNGWLLIDPRGVSGEVAYDVAVLAFKIAGEQPITEIATNLATRSNVVPERVQAWITIVDAARV